MRDEEISRPETVGGGEMCGGARLFASCAATAALGASLWAVLSELSCMECHRLNAILRGIPLAWAGVVFYAVLAVMAARSGFSRWTRAGFFAASGVHVVLLLLLWRERIFCAACVTAGAAAFIGGLSAVVVRPHAERWAVLVFAGAALATLGGTITARVLHTQLATPQANELPMDGQPASIAPGHVRLVVYEREGCKHCLEFDDAVLPRLQAAFGESLEVERREATLDMETPTILVQGKGEGPEFAGVPEYKELEDAVQQMLSRP